MPEPQQKNLAIIGYGKMGRLIDQLAPLHGFHVAARVDMNDSATAPLDNIDVAIEFTTPEAAPSNLLRLASLRIPAVCGTTGWYHELERVRQAVAAQGSALVWSPNFSIGMNVFQRIVSEAARMLQNESSYGAWAWEIHHAAKKDAPSGTLLRLIDIMREAGYSRPIDSSSTRAGAHPGTPEIGFDSSADSITLRHTARGREGFAHGALKAAQWIIGRSGCHEFSEVLFGR